MIIEKFIIADIQNEEANTFHFSDKANIITAKINTQGKSCLLKSLYYALGMTIRTFKLDWQIEKKMLKLFFTHNGERNSIIRFKNRIWINDNPNSVSLTEYAEWLSNLLNLKMKLPLKQTNEFKEIYPFAYFLPFYIDQDNSWTIAIYKNIVNEANQYNSSAIPHNLFEYFFNISNDEITQLEEDKQKLNTEKSLVTTRLKSVQELKENFISDVQQVEFDEEKAKEHIKEYLYFAENINKKIASKKQEIYLLEVKLDEKRLNLLELNDLLKSINTDYKQIEVRCGYCNAELTIQQSLQRLKLSNNKYDIAMMKEAVIQDILQKENKLSKLLAEKINLDNDYEKLMNVAQIKQKEITLQEYIENKSKSLTKDNYYKVQDKLNENIATIKKEVRRLLKRISELRRTNKDTKDLLKSAFEEIECSLNLVFPEVNLDKHVFMEFKSIENSGATKNAEYFILYMTYLKLLIDYSIVKLPFGIDSVIKDEVDETNKTNFYKIIEKYILKSNVQSFVVMLDDKIECLENPENYNFIHLEKPILDKNKYKELCNEFNVIANP